MHALNVIFNWQLKWNATEHVFDKSLPVKQLSHLIHLCRPHSTCPVQSCWKPWLPVFHIGLHLGQTLKDRYFSLSVRHFQLVFCLWPPVIFTCIHVYIQNWCQLIIVLACTCNYSYCLTSTIIKQPECFCPLLWLTALFYKKMMFLGMKQIRNWPCFLYQDGWILHI